MRSAAALSAIALLAAASVAIAQPPASDAPPDPDADAHVDEAPPSTPEAQAAARVHDEGGYPNDIAVLDDDAEGRGDGADRGSGQGPHGSVDLRGDRDGGEPSRTLDFPMPQFVQDILEALGRLLGIAARPLGYVLFALGIACVIALVVYLIVMMQLPRADLKGGLRRDGGSAGTPALDPLLEGSDASPEEHAAAGRWREAIHGLFLRALRDATRAGDVDRRGRTAREVVALVERAHGTHPELGSLLSLTELVWFGGRPATEAQYQDARGLADAVASRARTQGPALPTGVPA